MTAPARRPTLADVARVAGTSTAVVSYVVNSGPRAVSDATRVKVEAAIKQLDYRRDPLAGGLSAGRTNLVGLLVPDLSNAFFGELARHLEQEAHRRGFLTLLGNTNYDPAAEAEYSRALSDLRAAGTFVTSIGPWLPNSDGSPRIYLHSRPPDSRGPSVRFDDVGGAFGAVGHLVEHGFRRIACATGPGDHGPAMDRVRGWEQATARASQLRGRLYQVSFDRIEAEAALHTAFREGDPPRAVFATTDELALATLRAAAAVGLRVPDDLALVGFDGIREARYGHARLTTVAVPVDELARRALDALQDWDDGGAEIAVVLPTTLVIGETCGCSRG